jgi:hypothetical protein
MKTQIRFLLIMAISCFAFSSSSAHSLSPSPSSSLASSFGDTIVLPVRWVSFTATKKEANVLLQWTTLHEQFTKAFIIERSQNGRDFYSIGAVNASVTSYANINYQFFDTDPSKGLNCYRIRQVDENNEYSFSEIRKINFSAGDNQIILNGNVVKNGMLNLRIAQSKRSAVSVKIFSRQGILMAKKDLYVGYHSIDVSALQKGYYILQANDESKDFVIQ